MSLLGITARSTIKSSKVIAVGFERPGGGQLNSSGSRGPELLGVGTLAAVLAAIFLLPAKVLPAALSGDGGGNAGNGSAIWNFNGSGNYSDGTKWFPTQSPNGAGVTVWFAYGYTVPVNTTVVNVVVDSAIVAGTLNFDSNGTLYELGNDGIAGHGVTLNNNGSGAAINILSHIESGQIFSNLTLAEPTSVYVARGALHLFGQIGEINGNQSLTKTGAGALWLPPSVGISGGTTVNAGDLDAGGNATGALGSGGLTINANNALATVNLYSSQSISSLSGTESSPTLASLTVYGNATLTIAQSTNTIFAAGLRLGDRFGNTSGLVKSSSGTLELHGGLALLNNTFLSVNGGTLRLNLDKSFGVASIGTGVMATVSSGATLELAGTVSALSSGASRVNIINNSTATGILVSGTHQQVGNIDGSGTTQVNAGSDLTANHIVQSALVIGGTASSHALVTIDASDFSGNPLSQSSGLAVAGSLQPSIPFASGAPGSSSLDPPSAEGFGGDPIPADPSISVSGSASAVPEPSTLLLLGLGNLACLLHAIRRRAKRG